MGDPLAGLEAIEAAEVLRDEPLAPHTTLKVGGPARAFVRAGSAAALSEVARVCVGEGWPWLILGRGSNLLVADEGWPGVVVTLGRGFRGVRVEGHRVEAGGAEPMPALADKAGRAGLRGLAFGIAIPGSLGGAVRMNAGAHGHELRDVLEEIEVVRLAAGGAVERMPAADLDMRYRHTSLPPDAVVVRAWLSLSPGAEARIKADMDEMRAWRRAHQPIGEPSCGSVFRNPEGDSAGRLIEAAGMKGHRVGGARVSEVHANFITVEPGATARDVHRVIADTRSTVARRLGVMMETEVVLAGFEEAADR